MGQLSLLGNMGLIHTPISESSEEMENRYLSPARTRMLERSLQNSNGQQGLTTMTIFFTFR
jgi:hypothetical protein